MHGNCSSWFRILVAGQSLTPDIDRSAELAGVRRRHQDSNVIAFFTPVSVFPPHGVSAEHDFDYP
jgi:hypothetical protein